jgi:hypothetical protein
MPTWSLPRLARRPAHLVSPVLHRPGLHHLRRPVRRIPGPARRAHDHRDAGRRPPGRRVASRPSAPLLLRRPLVGGCAWLVLLDGIVTHLLSPQAPLALVVDDRQLVNLAVWRCLWYGTFGPQPVQVVLVRPPGRPDGYELVLVATDLDATQPSGLNGYAMRSPSKTPARSPASTRPAPHPSGRRSHRAVRPAVPEPDDLLVRAGRRRPRRCSPPTAPALLVPDEARPIGGRHARSGAPRAHRRPVSASSPRRAHHSGNPHGRAGVGLRRGMKCESRGGGTWRQRVRRPR